MDEKDIWAGIGIAATGLVTGVLTWLGSRKKAPPPDVSLAAPHMLTDAEIVKQAIEQMRAEVDEIRRMMADLHRWASEEYENARINRLLDKRNSK